MFSASEHSKILLVSPKPRNDGVISWIWEIVMQPISRPRLSNVKEESA